MASESTALPCSSNSDQDMHTEASQQQHINIKTSTHTDDTLKRELLDVHEVTPVGTLPIQPNLLKVRPATFRSNISTDLMSRLSSFLPAMQSSNEKLFSQLERGDLSRDDVNIEYIKPKEEKLIEMNLDLGVLDILPSSEIPEDKYVYINPTKASDLDSSLQDHEQTKVEDVTKRLLIEDISGHSCSNLQS
ncbi:hypothetical protein BATDEDRAFT_91586 [Batrachochytrium dendrobatidis JAM81]|uniref:Uncharacterized protein n=1 Tax=Batrachochytrium dendrobatidis (strain JAM81 / FGSC 10211) TaxID=684364 RepID=F4PAT2_BATDJ|nr:uncharacterized protein BATDEDRAFT_91586 [Batrachochytrium dendrobatidis JAM81]EGF77597.1 hypothetical protein BATDEDRAFT_91586 [Batrachochytrium dendrobatidis JAM81]KAJ8323851.1 hypothetical protein O5D80_007731 [Batrachochytrium dendrobatidis]KAK5666231.1 hypothetical protein QVD99_006997 [Batrachochytrium dendrobatidis]|eukprot:XP_006681769.1 hypothetical protein BATDEDRAFT_91586 [Batrachochytrium dendrobatidis JAM81]